jgi:hypothetical protein
MSNPPTPEVVPPHDARAIGLSLLAALAIAAVVLVTIIWPAEYGKDPTGVGAFLGLMVLTPEPDTAVETAAEQPVAASAPSGAQTGKVIPINAAPTDNMKVASRDDIRPQVFAYLSDAAEVTLRTGEWAEYKAHMFEGKPLLYSWTASGGDVYTDFHGDPTAEKASYPEGYWLRYQETEDVEGHGMIIAPFTGNHGWYWVNRNREPVSIRIEVSGFYDQFRRVGGSAR